MAPRTSSLRRLLGISAALAASLLSCGREPTAPAGGSAGAVRYSQGLSWIAQWPSGVQQFQAAGGSGVAFTKVRVVLNNADGTVALDTVINFPPGSDELTVTLNVPLPASAPASGVPLTLNLDYQNAAGETVFHGGPVTVNAVPAVPGAGPPPPSPVTIPIRYTGPGAQATRVRIAPSTLTVNTGQSFQFTAQALDANGVVVPGTPIVFASQNTIVASVNAATGAGVAGSNRGTADIVAQLFNGATDLATLTVVSPAASLSLVSGGGQSGPAGQLLPSSVVVRVLATDGQPAAGVPVSFAAGSGGSVGTASATTDASGNAQTTWRLGSAVGAQVLTATSGTLSGSPLTVSATGRAVDPVRVAFVVQPPASTAAGVTLAPAIVVNAVDATGTITTAFTGAVTLALGTGAPVGATLTGTLTANAVAGVATFPDLKLSIPGTYTLVATSPSLGAATSSSFAIVAGSANRLVFQNYPIAGAVAGTALDPITVQVRDALGNPVTSFSGSVSLTLNASVAAASNTPVAPGATAASGEPLANAVITGTTTVNAVAGVATFTGLKLNTAGSFTLTASSTGLTSGTGPVFAIVAGPASNLSLVSGGGQSAPGASMLANPIVVQITDAFGNATGSGATVTFTPASGSGSANPPSAVIGASGTAQTTWTVGGGAGAMTMNVSSAGMLPNPLVVTATSTVATLAGPATHLQFTTQPSNVAAAANIAPAIVVTAKDASNLVATSFTGNIALAIGTNPASGTLSGTLTVAAVAGVATFPSVAINNIGVGYTLTAASGALTGATSSAFNVGTPPVASTLVSPHSTTLTAIGATFGLAAQARDASLNPLAGSFTWVSRTPAVATVNTGGTVTALTNGAAWVVALEAGGTKDSALITVQQTLATIAVTPNPRNVYLGASFQFAAVAVDGLGVAMTTQPTFTWSSAFGATATVSATGLATGTGLGTTQVRATAGAVTGTAIINVLTPITRIVVSRDSAGFPTTANDAFTLAALGRTRSYRATARDTLDNVMTGFTFTWASSNGAVATLDSINTATVRATAAANGISSIMATAQGVFGGATLNVQQVLTAVDLSPIAATIAAFGSTALIARGKDANGFFIPGGTFTFASASPAIATVNVVTGVVTGVANGTAIITAQTGAITSNNATITVGGAVPAVISFGRDTLTVGRSGSVSVPIYLSKPFTGPVTVNLAVADTFAFFSTPSITIGTGLTSGNATLNGHNAGTTRITAVDAGSGGAYASATAVLAVQATVRLTTTGYSLNVTNQTSTQVLLSDPAPAGGTYVTFTYGTAGKVNVSPDPAFIPAGRLAANVVVLAVGANTSGTTVTPAATGVNGTASTVYTYPAVLTGYASLRLGAGQYEPNAYVQGSAYFTSSLAVTLTSSDITKITVPSTVTIPVGGYSQYYAITALVPGTANVTASATDWTSIVTAMTVTSPRVALYGGGAYNTTSPQFGVAVYTADSLRSAHPRTSSLVVQLTSTDPTVIQVLTPTITVPAGQYYSGSGLAIPGGNPGTAKIVATASGHIPDTVSYTVVGPTITMGFSTGLVGLGQQESGAGFYVQVPNYVTAPLTVTLSNTDSTIAGLPTTVTIPLGNSYAYFSVRGKALGSVGVSASAPGYTSSATSTIRVTSPRLTLYGGGTLNNFGPTSGLTVYSTDSLRSAHTRMTPLVVTYTSTNPAVLTVTAADTIVAGSYYTNHAVVTPVSAGTAKVIAFTPGHGEDSVVYTVVTPKLSFSFNTYYIGRRQYAASTDLYVSTPNYRTSPLTVTLTQNYPTVDSLSATSLTVGTNGYYATFGAAGLAFGTDRIIADAPGYLPDTAWVTVNTPKFTTGGLPGSATTTSPPTTVTVYANDSTGGYHYVLDTAAIARAVSSNVGVIQPTSRAIRIARGVYYGQGQVAFTGPGSASLTFDDSLATGYQPVTTNAVTVTGPSLTLSNYATVLGMRQNGGAGSAYVNVPNAITGTPLVVTLVSSDPTVVTVPATVTIPVGQYSVPFRITAHDVVGTIQIQATATGYGGTTSNVQVTAPKYLLYSATTLNTTSPRQQVTVYAADANGIAHYTNEDVTVTLSSSNPSAGTTDSAFVVIAAGTQYNTNARFIPGAVGTTQLTASDTRTASYKYGNGTVIITVNTPSLTLSWSVLSMGIGQYDNHTVYTPDYQTAGLTVNLAHFNAASTTPSSVTIPVSGSYTSTVKVTGATTGADMITASAMGHNSVTGAVNVAPGRVDPLAGWPTTLAQGDSALITLYARDVSTNVHYVAAATAFTLAPTGKIQFKSGGLGSAVITSVTIPADAQYVQFYVKALATGVGSGTAAITSANYTSYTTSSVVVP